MTAKTNDLKDHATNVVPEKIIGIANEFDEILIDRVVERLLAI